VVKHLFTIPNILIPLSSLRLNKYRCHGAQEFSILLYVASFQLRGQLVKEFEYLKVFILFYFKNTWLHIHILYVGNVFARDVALQEVHFKGSFAYFSPDQSTSYGLKKNIK